jgi:hypothetical protein
MVPFMIVGWIWQWYGNVPAVAKVCWNVPDDFWSELKLEPSSDVTVWVCPSESQPQVTVLPAVTENVVGLNRSFCTRISPAGGGLLDVPPESLPHANVKNADAALSAGISQCLFIRSLRLIAAGALPPR